MSIKKTGSGFKVQRFRVYRSASGEPFVREPIGCELRAERLKAELLRPDVTAEINPAEWTLTLNL